MEGPWDDVVCHFWSEIMVTITHEQNLICSKTNSHGTTHEQIIICKQLFAGDVVGFQPMRRRKICIDWQFMLLNKREIRTENEIGRRSSTVCLFVPGNIGEWTAGDVHKPTCKAMDQYSPTDQTSELNQLCITMALFNLLIIWIIIHQTHYGKSEWSRAFNQFTIAHVNLTW